MSVISVASSQPIAIVSDRFGRELAIVGGSALVCASMVAIPLASSFPQLLACIVPLSLGSTALTAAPVALTADLTHPKDRAQALSLLRTAGDMGLLLGAVSSGLLADVFSMEAAIATNGGLIGGVALWFAAKNAATISAAMHRKRS
jgi:MFS family permease